MHLLWDLFAINDPDSLGGALVRLLFLFAVILLIVGALASL